MNATSLNINPLTVAQATPGLTARADFDLAGNLAARGVEFAGASAQVAALGVARFFVDAQETVTFKLSPDDVNGTYTLRDLSAQIIGDNAAQSAQWVGSLTSHLCVAVYGKRPKRGKGKQRKTQYDLRIEQKAYDDRKRIIRTGVRFLAVVLACNTATITNGSDALRVFDTTTGFPFKRSDYVPVGATTNKPSDPLPADNRAMVAYILDTSTDVVSNSVKTLLDRHLPAREAAEGDLEADTVEACDTVIAFLKDKTPANVTESTRKKLDAMLEAIVGFRNRANAAAPTKPVTKPAKVTAKAS